MRALSRGSGARTPRVRERPRQPTRSGSGRPAAGARLPLGLALAALLLSPARAQAPPESVDSERFQVEAGGNQLTVWRAVPVNFSAIERLAAELGSPLLPHARAIRLDRQVPPQIVHYVLCVTEEGTLVVGQQIFSNERSGPRLLRGEIVRAYPPLDTSGAWTWLVDLPVSRERDAVLAVRATSPGWPIRAVMIGLAVNPEGAEPVTAPGPPSDRSRRRRRPRARHPGARRWSGPDRGRAGAPPAANPAGRNRSAVRRRAAGPDCRGVGVRVALALGLSVLTGCAGQGRAVLSAPPAGMPHPGPGPVATSAPPAPGPDHARLTEQLTRVAGELSDVQNALAKVVAASQLHDGQLLAVGRRLQELESRTQPGQVPRGFAPAGPPTVTAPAPPAVPAAVRPLAVPPGPQVRSAPAPPAASPANDLYGMAMARYRGGEVDAAILTLQELIANHPADPLRERAQFQLGEMLYAQRDLRAALQEYQELAAAVPPGPRSADALFKMGLCYRGLGDEPRAQTAWQRVTREFPDSPAARSARSFLRGRGTG